MGNLTPKLSNTWCRLGIFIFLFLSAQKMVSQSIITDIGGNSSIGLNYIDGAESRADESKHLDTTKLKEVDSYINAIDFSTTDGRLEISYYRYLTKWAPHYFGINGSNKIKNNISAIFSQGDLVPESQIQMKFGVRIGKDKNAEIIKNHIIEKKSFHPDTIKYILDHANSAWDLWLTTDAHVTVSSFKKILEDETFANQVKKQTFTGYQFNVGLNYWRANLLNSLCIAGATIGIKRTNNFDDLEETKIKDVKTVTDEASGITRTFETEKTAYAGNYKEETIYPLNMDVYMAPYDVKGIGLLGYTRTNFGDFKPKTDMGFGIYFYKPSDKKEESSSANNPIGGILFGFSDVFNIDKSDDDQSGLKKITIGLTARINLFNPLNK